MNKDTIIVPTMIALILIPWAILAWISTRPRVEEDAAEWDEDDWKFYTEGTPVAPTPPAPLFNHAALYRARQT